ncbi:MAG TPA: DUF1801 domain-containing protein [Pedobacter sp.]|uniref:DUF1801 domain-containing protein n=1 Tax=Pedobacter sp. TaxID=1411316 RepID=UPI002CDAFBAF|nr:DUF1801 domain-containing protein [Pedobacter sp.]HMI03504.1 DUF1801 domain-containing protein [Pedobacter sp.]
MAKNKTFETTANVTDFINTVEDETKRIDCLRVAELMTEVTGLEAKMWGPAIIGFGSYHYKYESGHEGDAPLLGFSPRKNAITLYLESKFPHREELLSDFGKHKIGGGCIYVKKLKDINMEVFKKMIEASITYSREKRISNATN